MLSIQLSFLLLDNIFIVQTTANIDTQLPFFLLLLRNYFFKKKIKKVIPLQMIRLGDEIESAITKYFTDDDRKKAMLFLRPRHRKQSHVITFFVGRRVSLPTFITSTQTVRKNLSYRSAFLLFSIMS